MAQQQSAFVLLGRIEHRAVLVAFVQGVVGAFNEDLCPFDEAGGKETGEGADEDFLEEGGVHPCLTAAMVPVAKVFTKCFANVGSGTGVAEFPAMADPAGPKPNEIDPDNLSRLLELELIQKRATWKQAGERYRSFRAAGFVFLFVLIVGCLIGGYFAFMRVNEQRTNPPTNSAVDR